MARTVAGTASTCYLPYRIPRLPDRPARHGSTPDPRSQTGDHHPPRRRPRRQPDPLRAPVRRLRRGLEPGHAHRGARGPRRPPRPGRRAPRRGRRRRRHQAQPRLQPHPRGGPRLEPRADDAGLRRHPGLRHRPRGRPSSSRTRSPWDRPTRGSPVASTRPPTRRSSCPRSCAGSSCGSTAPRRRPTGPRRRWPCGPPTSASRCPPTPSRAPACPWASTWPSRPQRWGITREAQDELALASHQQPRRRLRPRLLRRPADALPRADPRPEPARRHHPREARLAPHRLRRGATARR